MMVACVRIRLEPLSKWTCRVARHCPPALRSTDLNFRAQERRSAAGAVYVSLLDRFRSPTRTFRSSQSEKLPMDGGSPARRVPRCRWFSSAANGIWMC